MTVIENGGATSEPRSSATVKIALPRARSSGWILEIQDEEGAKRVPVEGGTLVLGSSRSADVIVCDATVSARHCEVTGHHDGVLVRDLGSAHACARPGGSRARR
jgi:hypothetical protein